MKKETALLELHRSFFLCCKTNKDYQNLKVNASHESQQLFEVGAQKECQRKTRFTAAEWAHTCVQEYTMPLFPGPQKNDTKLVIDLLDC